MASALTTLFLQTALSVEHEHERGCGDVYEAGVVTFRQSDAQNTGQRNVGSARSFITSRHPACADENRQDCIEKGMSEDRSFIQTDRQGDIGSHILERAGGAMSFDKPIAKKRPGAALQKNQDAIGDDENKRLGPA